MSSYSSSIKADMMALRLKNDCCRKNTARAMLACVPTLQFRDADVTAYAASIIRDDDDNVADKLDLTDTSQLRCAGCRAAILRGIFLATGSVSDPAAKEANLDLSFRSDEYADRVQRVLTAFGFDFRRRKRRTSTVLYLKSSDSIGAFFAAAGINRVIYDISNVSLVSDVANFVNRRSNADISNLRKSTDASERVCDAIRSLEREGKLHLLDETLTEVAKLRLEYPEMSLSQLAALSPTGISKAALASKLKRIEAIAAKNVGEDRE